MFSPLTRSLVMTMTAKQAKIAAAIPATDITTPLSMAKIRLFTSHIIPYTVYPSIRSVFYSFFKTLCASGHHIDVPQGRQFLLNFLCHLDIDGRHLPVALLEDLETFGLAHLG